MTTEEARAAMLARPEFQKEAVVRAAVRWCRIASEEGLTPFEAAVAWQRMGRTILREAVWRVAMGSLLASLCEELLAEMAELRATAQREGLEAPGRTAVTEQGTRNAEGGAA